MNTSIQRILFFVVLLTHMPARSAELAEMLPSDIIRAHIQPRCTLQEISWLKRVSQQLHKTTDVERICTRVLKKHPCKNVACRCLSENYYACTKVLGHHACRATNEKLSDNERAYSRAIFKHLFAYHAQLRNGNIMSLLKYPNIPVNKQIEIYREKYYAPKRIKKSIIRHLIHLLRAQNPKGAIAILQGNDIDIFQATILHPVLIWQLLCEANSASLIKVATRGSINAECLRWIMESSSPGLLNRLIKQNILPIDMCDSKKRNLLHYAAIHGFDNVIALLLGKGIYINSVDKKGMTPLHYAVKFAHVHAAGTFLAYNDTDPRIKNKNGKTALDYVSLMGKLASITSGERDNRCAIRQQLKNNIRKRKYANTPIKVHEDNYQSLD